MLTLFVLSILYNFFTRRDKPVKDAALLQVELNKNKPVIAFAGMWDFYSRGSMFTPQDSWRALLTCEIPIYDEKLAEAKIEQAKLNVKDIALKKEDLENGIKIQVEKSFLEIKEAQERLETSRVILQAAAEGYRIAVVQGRIRHATGCDRRGAQPHRRRDQSCKGQIRLRDGQSGPGPVLRVLCG